MKFLNKFANLKVFKESLMFKTQEVIMENYLQS